jgi:uncharacterized protein with gpF-like domain
MSQNNAFDRCRCRAAAISAISAVLESPSLSEVDHLRGDAKDDDDDDDDNDDDDEDEDEDDSSDKEEELISSKSER